MAYYKEGKKKAYSAGEKAGYAEGMKEGVYKLDSMHAKCIKEQNKAHKEQSSHGMPAQGK